MAIISCPECSKKLKTADTSIGKKVKCACGHIFVAVADQASTPVPAKAPSIVSPEKVFIACSQCQAKLLVPTTSLGKKMKCPKCDNVFITTIREYASTAPTK